LRSYERGVNTFDTANIYSNGLSEVYLGRAIKALNLPREEIVVMTKVRLLPRLVVLVWSTKTYIVVLQLYGAVSRNPEALVRMVGTDLDKKGYVNQHGLSRKVGVFISSRVVFLY